MTAGFWLESCLIIIMSMLGKTPFKLLSKGLGKRENDWEASSEQRNSEFPG